MTAYRSLYHIHSAVGKEYQTDAAQLETVASLLLAVVITGLSAITPAFADYDPGFDVDAEAVYFINLDTGKADAAHEKDADKKVYPASTTKIMTALLALENIPDLDTPQIELKLYIQNALSGTGASLAGILRGETFTPRELRSMPGAAPLGQRSRHDARRLCGRRQPGLLRRDDE